MKETLWVHLNEESLCQSCASQSSDTGNPLTVRGTNGTSLSVSGSVIVFSAKGKEIVIPIANIQEFEIIPPKNYYHGGINIKTAKAADSALWVGFGVSLASNSIGVSFIENLEIAHAKNIQAYIATFNSARPAGQPSSSAADEIGKFKKLLDAGAITKEEFEAKKRKLLDL